MPSRSRASARRTVGGDRGSVTAEFVAVVPAVLLVLGCCLAAVQVAGLQLRLQDAVAVVARASARGETLAIGSLVSGATSSLARQGSLLCVTARVSSPLAGGLLGSLDLTARSCAAASGQ